MLTLYGFGPAFDLPDPSPFVMKTEIQLKMAGVPYRFERAAPQAAPKGKIPFIQVGAHRVGDSTFIRAHIEKHHRFDFDAGLSTHERAQAWAIERMLEDHLYFAIVQHRWLDDENWHRGPSHFFDGAPEGVAEDARRRVRENLHGHGISRHLHEETADLAERSLASLSVILGDKPYVMGEEPSGVDATAAAMVAAALTPFFTGELRRRAEKYANLTAYRDRMFARYYPSFAKKLAA
ncbi:MAG: glutathione S-transferase family protein [Proteobacteria bacterium]|nr:glutathione S-transferase family protein [Pseudomonadota bacterium]